MNDKTLTWTAGTISIIGIIILLLTKPEIQPNQHKITGTIKEIRDQGKISKGIIEAEIPIISFNKNLTQGKATITGRLQEYNGRIELVIT